MAVPGGGRAHSTAIPCRRSPRLLSRSLFIGTPTASVPGDGAGVVLVALVAAYASHPLFRAGSGRLADPSRTGRQNAHHRRIVQVTGAVNDPGRDSRNR